MKGLVLFDYDGTLVDERDNIVTPTSLTKQAVEMLQAKGYLCALATGRALSYIPNGAKDLFLDGYVTSNGACVSIHGKEIFHDVFADEELQNLLQFFDENDINYILENAERCYVKDMKDPEYLHFLDNFHTPRENYVAFKDFVQVRNRIEKITLVFKTHDKMKAFGKEMSAQYAISYHRNCNTYDIAKPHISKRVGAKAIVDYYDIPMEHTYAFGDGDNDVELLDFVKHGIAMGIHDEALDDVLDMVTTTVKEEGIYKALKKLEVI